MPSLIAAAVGVTAVAGAETHQVFAGSSFSSLAPGFQDWPTWRHDQGHSGVSAETALGAASASKMKLHWAAKTGAKSYSSPAIVYNTTLAESLVYVGNQAGSFNAYNAVNGALVWSFHVPATPKLSKEIETSPAVSNGVVYFGAGEYHEYALNATTGSLICTSQSLGGITAASPVVGNPDGHGDVVYFGDAGPNGNLSDGGHEWAIYGVGNTAGTACGTKWSFDNFGSPPGNQTGISGVYSSQAYGQLADGTPVLSFGTTDPDDSVYELNANTGAELWRFQTVVGIDSDVGAPPTISAPGVNGFADGVVYATGKDAIIYALDLKTGAQIWQFNVRAVLKSGNPSQSAESLVGNTVYIGWAKGVIALNATTGALIWKSPATAGVVSMPAISGGPGNQVIFVGDLKGLVHGFSLATGASLFSYSTGALIFGSAAVSTGQMFIAGSNGTLYAFGL
jgi:eukaryotic-like serine/threonine-protein kinase